MKTLLLSISQGMSVRNILRSPVFPLLREHCRVVILTPYARDPAFRREWDEAAELAWLGPGAPARTRALSFYLQANYWGFWLERRPDTVAKYRRRLRDEGGRAREARVLAGAGAWNVLRRVAPVRRAVERQVLRHPDLADLRGRFAADAVLTVTHDVAGDVVLAAQARREGLPLAIMAHSWDALPSRGRLLVQPDRLLVWNRIMAEQAVELQGVPADRVCVTGIPQYDDYASWPIANRSDYLRRLGLGADARLVTYTCSAERVVPDEAELIEELAEIVASGAWGDAVLVVRLHPAERTAEFRARFAGRPRLLLDEPDPSFAAARLEAPAADGRDAFIQLMAHSDVVLNVASTTTIDAALFDTPVVNVAYNPALPAGRWNAAAGWYESSHYRAIVAAGGARLAHSRAELVQRVAEYLAQPSLDAEGRTRIIAEQCQWVDGRSSLRVAACVLDMMGVRHDLDSRREPAEQGQAS